jgi:hypothetical protein
VPVHDVVNQWEECQHGENEGADHGSPPMGEEEGDDVECEQES